MKDDKFALKILVVLFCFNFKIWLSLLESIGIFNEALTFQNWIIHLLRQFEPWIFSPYLG